MSSTRVERLSLDSNILFYTIVRFRNPFVVEDPFAD
jgi:hypothetical protein